MTISERLRELGLEVQPCPTETGAVPTNEAAAEPELAPADEPEPAESELLDERPTEDLFPDDEMDLPSGPLLAPTHGARIISDRTVQQRRAEGLIRSRESLLSSREQSRPPHP